VTGSVSPPDPLFGRVIAGKFEIRELIGGGAMGRVYRAHHLTLEKTIAIKVLKNSDRDTQIAGERLRIEARAASRLDHPNTLRILDFGEDGPDGLLYIAMEYLEGRTLREILEIEGQLPPPRIARIVAQVCSALAEAHDKGIIHRDLKPGNIMLVRRHTDHGPTDEFVKVCDFGLAKLIDIRQQAIISHELTGQGLLVGTPGYMPPEQIQGRALDGRSDLYACGVLMYRAASGRPPFQGRTLWEITDAHLNTMPAPLSELVPGIDDGFEGIIKVAMAKDPAARFQTAFELRDALRGFLERVGESLPPSESQIVRRPSTAPDGATIELYADTASNMRRSSIDPSLSKPAVELEPTASMARPLTENPPRASRLAIAAITALFTALLLALVALSLGRKGGDDPGPGIAPSPPAPRPISVTPSVAAPRAAIVALTIVDSPPGTEVWTTHGLAGLAPGKLELEWTGAPIKLTFKADGFLSETRAIESEGEIQLSVPLRRRPLQTPDTKRGKGRTRDSLENPFGDNK
jgi:serine/threonine protein kinase